MPRRPRRRGSERQSPGPFRAHPASAAQVACATRLRGREGRARRRGWRLAGRSAGASPSYREGWSRHRSRRPATDATRGREALRRPSGTWRAPPRVEARADRQDRRGPGLFARRRSYARNATGRRPSRIGASVAPQFTRAGVRAVRSGSNKARRSPGGRIRGEGAVRRRRRWCGPARRSLRPGITVETSRKSRSQRSASWFEPSTAHVRSSERSRSSWLCDTERAIRVVSGRLCRTSAGPGDANLDLEGL